MILDAAKMLDVKRGDLSGQSIGERLRGKVLSQAGSDLLLVRQDGSSQQDVRLILRTMTEA